MKKIHTEFFIIYFVFQCVTFIVTLKAIAYSALICIMFILLQFTETQKATFNTKELFIFIGMPLCLIFLLFSLGINLFSAVATLKKIKGKPLTRLQILSAICFPRIIIITYFILIILLL